MKILTIAVATFAGGFLFKYVLNANAESTNYTKLSKPAENNHYYNNTTWGGAADPTMIKKGDTYYAYSTSGNGGHINAKKTKDFRTWNEFTISLSGGSGYSGLWAPEVYLYNGTYYLFVTGHRCEGISAQCYNGVREDIAVATASSPEGPYSSLTRINSEVVDPIDPTILFDNGKIYMYTKSDFNKGEWCTGERDSVLYVEELSSDLKSVVPGSKREVLRLDADERGNRVNCWEGIGQPKDDYNYWENDLLEAPTILKKNGVYYLLYSTDRYDERGYTIGYATSSSPTGSFVRATRGNGTNVTAPLLHGSMTDHTMYGTGHGFIYQESENEMWIVYHSLVPESGARRLNMDYIGLDSSSGKLFVNGPTAGNQPAPSSVNGVYRLSNSDYTVSMDGVNKTNLKDYINKRAELSGSNIGKTPLVTASSSSGKQLKITLTEEKNIEDIWIHSGESTLSGSATVVINGKYQIDGSYSVSGSSAKIQLPTGIKGGVKTIDITFSNNTSLSEVNLYHNNNPITPLDTFTITFNANGGTLSGGSTASVTDGSTINLSTHAATRAGYTFEGWSTKKDDASTKVSNTYKPTASITLYALWGKITYHVTEIEGEEHAIGDGNSLTLKVDAAYDKFANGGSILIDGAAIPSESYTHASDANGGTLISITSSYLNSLAVGSHSVKICFNDGGSVNASFSITANSDPDTPINPDDPVNPENPDNPVNPENPDNPVNPDDPVNPTEPDSSDYPIDPDNPVNPINPTGPTEPATPTNPEDSPSPAVPATSGSQPSTTSSSAKTASTPDTGILSGDSADTTTGTSITFVIISIVAIVHIINLAIRRKKIKFMS